VAALEDRQAQHYGLRRIARRATSSRRDAAPTAAATVSSKMALGLHQLRARALQRGRALGAGRDAWSIADFAHEIVDLTRVAVRVGRHA